MVVDGKHLTVNLELIVMTTRMENSSRQYNREIKIPISKIRIFYRPGKPLLTTRKLAYHISSILYPWNEVIKVIMNIFTMEGRFIELF